MSHSKFSSLDPSTFLQLQEEERQRLALALSSGPGQILANALMEVEYALPLVVKDPRMAQTGLNTLRNELREGLVQLQAYIAELQPPLLAEMGLGPSIPLYLSNFGERYGIEVQCSGCEQFRERYPATIETALFRILQDALTNVAEHAEASLVRVELEGHTDQLRMVIQDNGRGFITPAERSSKKRQLGLIAMRDRAELLGGQMQLFSENGRGVRVVITIPYHGHSLAQVAPGGREPYERTTDKPARTRGNNHGTKAQGRERKPLPSE